MKPTSPAAGPEPDLHRAYCAVIPAFRERAAIASTVAAALEQGVDVIVVDDGSDDDTADQAGQAGARVIRLERNRGKGVALATGLKAARDGGYVAALTLDADGQHDPAEIPKFIEAYERTRIPVLIGNRLWNPEGMPWIRRLTNRFMSWLLAREMGQYVPDTQCGYRLFRCDLLPYIETKSERFAAESEVLLNISARGIPVDSVRIRTIYAGEKSKINPFSDTLRFTRMLLEHRRTRAPMHRGATARPETDH